MTRPPRRPCRLRRLRYCFPRPSTVPQDFPAPVRQGLPGPGKSVRTIRQPFLHPRALSPPWTRIHPLPLSRNRYLPRCRDLRHCAKWRCSRSLLKIHLAARTRKGHRHANPLAPRKHGHVRPPWAGWSCPWNDLPTSLRIRRVRAKSTSPILLFIDLEGCARLTQIKLDAVGVSFCCAHQRIDIPKRETDSFIASRFEFLTRTHSSSFGRTMVA